MEIDGREAERFVFRRADGTERTLDYVWVDGRTVFIATFSTSVSDFGGAEATFDRIAATFMATDAPG